MNIDLNQPITVGSLIVVNLATILPIVYGLFRLLWYVSQIVHQHEQVWTWFVSGAQQPPPAPRGSRAILKP